MENLNFYIGCIIVLLVTSYRFNLAPPPKPALPQNLPRQLGIILNWFQFKKNTSSSLFPPPRANTTLFKFWLYRAAYTVLGLIVFMAITKFPNLADEVQKIIDLASQSNMPVLKKSGPVVLAFIVAVVFPVIPPFVGADRSLRRYLFERASIPAQQLRERNVLRKAEYDIDPKVLSVVKNKLQADGFDARDIVFEAMPTTRSLWTKIAVLLEYISEWQGQDKYKTAFALLKERDSDILSVDRVTDTFEALKGNARECFAGKRSQLNGSEMKKREDAFRSECKELLVVIYDLLSRVSLKSHFTESERIKCAAEIGFKIEQRPGGPVPDSNDLITLGLVLSGVCLLPLSYKVGFGRAVMITVIIFTAVLVPILIADKLPGLPFRRNGYTPSVAYPFMSGFTVMALTVMISTVYSSINFAEFFSSGADLFDLTKGWKRYIGRSYPWTALPVLYAILIASRIRTGSYPDTACLRGFQRYRAWGCLLDAGIFLICTTGVMIFFVMPKVAVLWGNPAAATEWTLLARPGLISSTLGFFVPTWYRARSLSRKQTAPPSQPPVLDIPVPV